MSDRETLLVRFELEAPHVTGALWWKDRDKFFSSNIEDVLESLGAVEVKVGKRISLSAETLLEITRLTRLRPEDEEDGSSHDTLGGSRRPSVEASQPRAVGGQALKFN